MVPMGLALADPLMLCDKIHIRYGDRHIPLGTLPATTMHGCVVRQPRLALISHSRQVCGLNVFRGLAARNLGGRLS